MTNYLTPAQLNYCAPSIYAERPSLAVSEKYAFVPTTQVLNTLRDAGWLPVRAQETNVRKENKQGFQKHMLRLRHMNANFEMKVGDSLPEIVLTNSHDGLASFQLSLGLYRLVCSNGLVVADGMFESAKIRHMGYQDESVIQVVNRVIHSAPQLTEAVETFQDVQLTDKEQVAFATGAMQLRWTDEKPAPIHPRDLLEARRWSDSSKSVWSTFNTIQENLLKGGIETRTPRGRRTSTREVQSVSEDIRLNKALWTMAQALTNHKLAV